MTLDRASRVREAKLQVARLNGGALPQYCTAEVSRHGLVCIYFRMVGKTGRVRMHAEPRSAQFYADYAALLKGGSLPKPPAKMRSAARPHTWRWLCECYFGSFAFRNLAARGQGVRRRTLEQTYHERTPAGFEIADCPLQRFDAKLIRALRDRKIKWTTDETGERTSTNLEAANSLVKYIRGVLTFAVAEYPELVERNWAKDVSLLATGSEGIHTWTLDELATFERHFSIGTKARLTFALGLYTGQRLGDLARLGRVFEKDGMLVVDQEKGRRRKPVTAFVPVVPALRSIIDASQTGDLFYVVKANGEPYRKESLGNRFKKWCREAGLPHCSIHGLRKACVVRLIMDDCTPHQIMAVTGHRTLKEIDRYARNYMRERSAKEVLARWLAKHAA